MNKLESKLGASVAAVVLAGLAMAAPRPAVAQYAFSTVDFPGAASTDLLGFTTRTMVGQFADADGNTHGWLFSAKSGPFQQFDAPGAWLTTLSAINHRGDFGGVYRDDLDHPARRHGFIVVNDVLTTIDYPGSARTTIVQMNDRGQAVRPGHGAHDDRAAAAAVAAIGTASRDVFLTAKTDGAVAAVAAFDVNRYSIDKHVKILCCWKYVPF